MAPPGKYKLSGEIVTKDGLLLASETVTPPERAGLERKTGNAAVSPGPSTIPAVIVISAPALTATLVEAPVTFGALLPALTTALPELTPVIETATAATFAGKKTDAGTVATPGLLEESDTVNPPTGAGEDSIRDTL